MAAKHRLTLDRYGDLSQLTAALREVEEQLETRVKQAA